ncbi:hypothetical protein OIO90_000943 [Microbotryomycetes sp. JL221]|nr:hypothetical protein OIO90_000943 [Microbotryomycetes sp. JL221]
MYFPGKVFEIKTENKLFVAMHAVEVCYLFGASIKLDKELNIKQVKKTMESTYKPILPIVIMKF